MSTLHQLPDRIGAEQEAGDWIARLHADDVTSEDLERFKAWCEAHPRHTRIFEDMADTIDEVKRGGRIVRAVNFGNAMNVAASQPLRQGGRISSEGHRRIGFFAAAAALLTMTTGSVWWLQRSAGQPLFQTAVGEHATIELPDGSRLDLNSNSAARLNFSEHARFVTLVRGEAYFTVAHDRSRPFVVAAAGQQITALGTAFNVYLKTTGVRVTVTQGKIVLTSNDNTLLPTAEEGERHVANGLNEYLDPHNSLAPQRGTEPREIKGEKEGVQANTSRGNKDEGTEVTGRRARESALILIAGQQAEFNSGSARILPASPSELTRLANWRKGKLYFENQTLESVVDELSRYTNTTITIQNEDLRQMPIGGTFQANPQGVETLLELLQQGFGLQTRRDGGSHIYIYSVTSRAEASADRKDQPGAGSR